MIIDYNGCLNLVTAKQNAEIVKMVSENVISSKQAKDLLTIVVDENKKQIEGFVKCGDYGQKL